MKSSYLLLGGLRVHYLHWNLGSGGRQVVLLHDVGENARLWDRMAERLAAAGLVPLAPDLRGHGLTDKPEQGYAMIDLLRDLGGFWEAMNLEHPLLVGQGWGGTLALEWAARFPAGPKAPAGVVWFDGGQVRWDPDMQGGGTGRSNWISEAETLPLQEYLEGLSQDTGRQLDEADVPLLLASFEISEDEMITPLLNRRQRGQILQSVAGFRAAARLQQAGCLAMVALAPPGGKSPGEKGEFSQRDTGEPVSRKNLRVEWLEDNGHPLLDQAGRLANLVVEFEAGLVN